MSETGVGTSGMVVVVVAGIVGSGTVVVVVGGATGSSGAVVGGASLGTAVVVVEPGTTSMTMRMVCGCVVIDPSTSVGDVVVVVLGESSSNTATGV